MTDDIRRALGVLCITVPLLVAGLLMPEGDTVRTVLLIAGGWGTVIAAVAIGVKLIRGEKPADLDAPQPR